MGGIFRHHQGRDQVLQATLATPLQPIKTEADKLPQGQHGNAKAW